MIQKYFRFPYKDGIRRLAIFLFLACLISEVTYGDALFLKKPARKPSDELCANGPFYISEIAISPCSESGAIISFDLVNTLMCYSHALLENGACLGLNLVRDPSTGSDRIRATPFILESEQPIKSEAFQTGHVLMLGCICKLGGEMWLGSTVSDETGEHKDFRSVVGDLRSYSESFNVNMLKHCWDHLSPPARKE